MFRALYVHCGLANYHILVRTVDGRMGWAARWLHSITSLLSPLFRVVRYPLGVARARRKRCSDLTETYNREEKHGQPSAQYFNVTNRK
jgi:hypothetical protein